jgi:hypothetical protein
VWERREKWRRMEERRGKVRKWTDVPLHLSPDIININNTRLQEMKHSLDADGDDKNTYHNLTDHITQ